MSDAEISEQFVLSWDPAKTRDYSAIAVTERVRLVTMDLRQRGFEPPVTERQEQEEIRVRHVQRLKQGTDFVQQVEIVAALFRMLPVRKEPAALCLDAGGLGRPLLDIAKKRGLSPYGILLTGGSAESRPSRYELHVPRKVLLTNTAVLLQNGMLQIADDLPEADGLTQELSSVRYRAQAENDDVTDDMAFAVMLGAYFHMRRPKPLRVVPGGAISMLER